MHFVSNYVTNWLYNTDITQIKEDEMDGKLGFDNCFEVVITDYARQTIVHEKISFGITTEEFKNRIEALLGSKLEITTFRANEMEVPFDQLIDLWRVCIPKIHECLR